MKKSIMKKCIVLLFALLVGAGVYAQNDGAEKSPIGRVRVETNLGAQLQLYKVGAELNQIGYSLGAEVRYMFADSPWDVGIGSRAALFKRYYEEAVPLYLSSQHYLAADYNYRISDKFKLFSGLEIGFSVSYDLSEYNKTQSRYASTLYGINVPESQYIYTSKPLSPYIAPRIGFEAWNTLRVSLVAGFMDKGDSNASIRIGLVF